MVWGKIRLDWVKNKRLKQNGSVVGGRFTLAAVTCYVGVLRCQVGEVVVRTGDTATEDVEDSGLQLRQTSLNEQNLQTTQNQSKESFIYIETK